MEFTIGKYKVRGIILIAIIIIFWIMFGHMLCSCCKISYKDGFTSINDVPVMDLVKGQLHSSIKSSKPSTKKEGFVGSNKSAYGPEFAKAGSSGNMMNPDSWSQPSLVYSPGTTPDAGVQAIWNRPKQPIPLPEGELDMFATTPFKPECCPNAFSSSMGCACLTTDQYNYLRDRGGNNVPYSEY